MTDENTDLILKRLDTIDSRLDTIDMNFDVIDTRFDLMDKKFDKSEADRIKLEKDWNEKFFQLSRDTLNFSRNIIVTTAVVAVVAPLLRESLTFALEILKQMP